MKILIRGFRTIIVLAAIFALPHLAPAATKKFTIGVSPSSTNVLAGIATNVAVLVTDTSPSGNTFAGVVTNGVSVSPSGQGVTASFSGSSLVTVSNSPSVPAGGSASLTVYISATAGATANIIYTVTITGTNATATGNSPIPGVATAKYSFIYGNVPTMVWTPAGVDINWSSSGNWSPNGPPGILNDATFLDVGASNAVGVVNNTVDNSLAIGSLTYGQTNNFHTTLIGAGKTLTVGGDTVGLVAGTGADNGDGQVTTNTIKGAGGALVLTNTSANVLVGQSHPTTGTTVSHAQAALDLSGLDTFTATVSRMLVGVDVSIKGSSGVLNLAKTNKITATVGSAAPQIDVGDNSLPQSSPAVPSILLLGQTNAFFADSIAVGRGKTDGTGPSMLFNSAFANRVAYFRGSTGNTSRVGMWTIGDGFGSRVNFPNDCHGTVDLSGGSVNALVDTMFVGKGASTDNAAGANVTGTGTLIFNAGTADINTLEIGYTTTVEGLGTVNANGGSLVVNTNLELAHGPASVGTINISSATVSANAGIIAGGGTATITINSGTLNATNTTATIGTSGSPLTTLAVTNSTLKVAAQNSTPSASVGTLSCDGANTINISSVPVITGLPAQFQIVKYASPDGNLASFSLGTMPSGSPAYQGYISNNTGSASIDLVITNGPVVYPLIWVGSPNGNWDINATANWKTNGFAATYQQGYQVVQFDDSLTGTSSVNLTTTLTPGSLTVNNSVANYTFSGSGKLSGSTGLIKNGTAALTVAESGGNDFTGAITLGAGTLQVGNGGTSGNLGAGNVSIGASAALVFDRSDNLIVPNILSGSGSLTQNGPAVLTLNPASTTFAGAITVAQGTLKAGNAAALGTGAGSATVNSNAALDVNGQQFNNTEPVTVVGPGVGGNGAITSSGTNQTKVLRNVTLTGNTTFGGSGDWDIHSSANAASDASLSTSGNNFKLTKAGTNTITLFGVSMDSNLGDIDVLAGTLSVERNTTGLGNSGNTLTVYTNATLQFNNASNVWNKVVVLKDGATLRGVNRDEFAGPVALESGVGTVNAGSGSQLILDGILSGTGGLTKNGAGAVSLASANTYSGATLVSQGTLTLTSSGSIDSSTSITLSGGTALDLSALASPTLTLTSGRSLKGSGTVIGSVTMATGSTLIVGGPGTNTVGTLTVTNSLVLQAGSTNLMEISKAGGSANDEVVATNVTYGGTLTVTGLGGAYVAGDAFRLFAASTYIPSSFSTINLPIGVTWDTSTLGTDGTIKVISVAQPQIGNITPAGGGSFQLSFSGPAGNNYRVWSSTNLASPTWTVLTNGLFGASGNATFVDTTAANIPARFYRISVP